VAARVWSVKHEIEILDEFTGLLSRPNLASDEAGIQANANAVKALLEQRGIKSRLVETPGAPPVVYGQWPEPGATRTVVFYAHYDGQPLNPKDWVTPPWDPVLRDGPLELGAKIVSVPKQREAAGIPGEWRLYARSASDDKAPIIALLTAIDALRARASP